MKNPFSFSAAATTDRNLAAIGSTNGESAVISVPNSSTYLATNGSTNGDSAGISIPKSSTYATVISGKYQHLLDKSNPHVLTRWTAFSILATNVVCYVLGCYMVYLLTGFLAPANVENADDPVLPMTSSDGHRIFVRM